ncbi:MAG: biopolymer transporter ExbD [Gammaproteobacteria bacterium]|nr:biopolymer transporter ExbD [Gammaproteobacteria bacterium]
MSLFKRMRRTRVGEREDATLNLIPLIDIMSVMVAFLLVYSTDVEVVQNSKGVAIPQSTAQVKPRESVVVMVTKQQLFVQGELVASVADISNSPDRLVEPLRQVLERPSVEGTQPSADVASREITVMADKSLQYEVLKKVMATCTAASFGRISLAVMQKEQ